MSLTWELANTNFRTSSSTTPKKTDTCAQQYIKSNLISVDLTPALVGNRRS